MRKKLLFALMWGTVLYFAGVPAQAARPLLVLEGRTLEVPARQLAASLQGIANRTPAAPRVFVLTRESDETWLAYAARVDSQPVQPVTLDELLAQVKPYLKGQVLYDPKQPSSLDAASTAAGVQGAALTDKDLGLNTLYDFRTKWDSSREAYAWIVKTLVPQVDRHQLALLTPTGAMRDYAIQRKMLTLSAEGGMPADLLQEVLLRYDPGTVAFGEYRASLVSTLSESGQYLMPGNGTANLSFYAAADATPRFYQYPGHVEPVAPRYLALIFDCSDLDTAVNVMPELWQNSTRGSVPLGWAIPGTLAASAPAVAHRYYAEAYKSGNDSFVLGPSGAGFADLSRQAYADGFYEATAKAAEALDARTCLFDAPAAREALGPVVGQLARQGGIRGVFALAPYDQPPALFHGIPTLTTPYINSVEQGVTYLNRIPLDRRFAAMCLNANTMTPEDAARLAAHVSSRYVLMPPAEMLALMASVARGDKAEPAAVHVKSAEFPEGTVSAAAPVPIRVEIEPVDQVAAAELVYRPAGSRFAFSRPLEFSGELYRASLPPVLAGGGVEIKVRAVDTAGRVTWSPTWKLEVERKDSDGDGLSDAEEAYLLTDPAQPDSDGDGLKDGEDPRPLAVDRSPAWYVDAMYPPSDVPALTNPKDSDVTGNERTVQPGQSARYRLSLTRVPPEGTPVVALEAEGPAVIAQGPDATSLTTAFSGELTGRWQSAPVRVREGSRELWVQVTCPAEAKAPLVLYSIALTSGSSAPSVRQLMRSPASPGPDQPIAISAVAFDPRGIAEVVLNYRVNGKGVVSQPMVANGSRYELTLPARANRDELQYWITAENGPGQRTATVPETVTIGGRGRELIALRARRNFVGSCRPSPEWGGAASYAPEPGASDTAPANLTGGLYTVWVLAAGRGNGLAVSVDKKLVGAIDPGRPDGWQQVGRVRLDAGKHRVTVTGEAASGISRWTDPRYAAVALSTDSGWTPPEDQVFDVINSLALLSPRLEDPLSGMAELRATGAGNLTGMEISVDGQLVRRVSGPPFSLSLSTTRYANGPHTLRLEAVDRTGPTGLALDLPISVAN